MSFYYPERYDKSEIENYTDLGVCETYNSYLRDYYYDELLANPLSDETFAADVTNIEPYSSTELILPHGLLDICWTKELIANGPFSPILLNIYINKNFRKRDQ